MKESSKKNQVIIYKTEDGSTQIEVRMTGETVWLSQKQMAELFEKDVKTVNEHIKNIFSEGELSRVPTVRKFRIVQKEGPREIIREIEQYNLDVIISVGYRVKSFRGTQFRIWATKTLREYIVKGFVMDDERLANGGYKRGYFGEMLERVRKIRASERNLYEKVKDIFSTSADYDTKADYTKKFYAAMQNKFHHAITGKTAAELVVNRIDSRKENLGMTNYKKVSVTRQEAEIAKNYMLETELRQLYLLVEQFLSYAEFQIERQNVMYMKDWDSYLDNMLKANKLEILSSKGKISHKEMEKIVRKEITKFNLKKLKN
ncbi:MAG: virulence RhuM family protein [Candidatus Berkelbacteria bacterium]|nr:virulence RhuM family protein [Candidatus Berkelbacteria bacterium]